jgi:hypothetical protein
VKGGGLGSLLFYFKAKIMTTKKRYYKLKKAGLCVDCGKNKPVPGHVRCPYCQFSANQIINNYRKKNLQQELERCRNVKKRLKKEGKCPRCGTLKPDHITTIKCQNCAERIETRPVEYPLYYPGGKYENYNKGSSK